MFKVVLLSLISISFNYANAVTKQIAVQCQLEGPVYKGSVTYPDNIAEWAIKNESKAGQCHLAPIYGFELTFNGITYRSAADFSLYTGNGNMTCDSFKKSGFLNVSQWGDVILSNSMGFTAVLGLQPKETDTNILATPTSLTYGQETCVIQDF